jgi:hypothetical protein
VEKVGDPTALFAAAAIHFPQLARRAVIHLGGASDPRFLLGMPASMKYLSTIWLRYALPSFRGRMMVGADVAYTFGEAPKGIGCVPCEGPISQPGEVNSGHPCPRRIAHVKFLVGWFGGESIIDPFAGLGTTLTCAKNRGIRAIGIEIEEKYCEIAARRMSQEVLDLRVRVS